MKTIKVSEAQGQALDWLVAKCQGHRFAVVYGRGAVRFKFGVWAQTSDGETQEYVMRFELDALHKELDPDGPLRYQTTLVWEPTASWSQGGPIIEREGINVEYDGDWVYDPANQAPDDEPDNGDRWLAAPWNNGTLGQYGPTPLIAAMRCYVASKLGETAEVPEELLA